MKRRPTTSGIATTGGVLEAGALTVGLAGWVPVGDEDRELAGDGVREPAGEGEGRLAGTAEAESGGTAAAALDRDADAAVAGVFAGAAWLAGGGVPLSRAARLVA
ncbi:MAG: hypothetical protein ACRDNO_15255, partial [Trebonia sp.]